MFDFKITGDSHDQLNKDWDMDKATKAVAALLISQVNERFNTEGRSGGVSWSSKAFADGRSVLRGRHDSLRKGFYTIIDGDTVTLQNDLVYASIQQNGGTIHAHGRALRVPLTDSGRNGQGRAGRIKNGVLQVKVGEEWVDGKPDFIFLKRVRIPARPMLPDSASERAEQREVAERFAGPQGK